RLDLAPAPQLERVAPEPVDVGVPRLPLGDDLGRGGGHGAPLDTAAGQPSPALTAQRGVARRARRGDRVTRGAPVRVAQAGDSDRSPDQSVWNEPSRSVRR